MGLLLVDATFTLPFFMNLWKHKAPKMPNPKPQILQGLRFASWNYYYLSCFHHASSFIKLIMYHLLFTLSSFTLIYLHLPSFTLIHHHSPYSTRIINFHNLSWFTLIHHHSFIIIHHSPPFIIHSSSFIIFIMYHQFTWFIFPSFIITHHHLSFLSCIISFHHLFHLPSFTIIHHLSTVFILYHHLPSFFSFIIFHQFSPVIIIYYNVSSFISTHHHPPSCITIHHQSS